MISSRLLKNKRQYKHKLEDCGADTRETINHAT